MVTGAVFGPSAGSSARRSGVSVSAAGPLHDTHTRIAAPTSVASILFLRRGFVVANLKSITSSKNIRLLEYLRPRKCHGGVHDPAWWFLIGALSHGADDDLPFGRI